MAQVIEHLPSNLKALNSKLSIATLFPGDKKTAR
jgi:hypothetical protein